MCGIGGLSVADCSALDTSLIAQLLMAGVAERGADASGYAWIDDGGLAHTFKQPVPARELLEHASLLSKARALIVHVRRADAGSASIAANNHPIRYGQVCGAHVGLIRNAEELFVRMGRDRSDPDSTVDSEAIFMALDVFDDPRAALSHLVGTWTIAYFDNRELGLLRLVRGLPDVYLGVGDGFALFSSTRDGLDFVRDQSGLEFDVEEVPSGTSVALRQGHVVSRETVDLPAYDQRLTEYDWANPLAIAARTRAASVAADRRAAVATCTGASLSDRGRR